MDIIYYLENHTFEWNDRKATKNVDKHGVTFEEASEAYLDEFGIFGDASRGNELREYLIGYSYARNLLFVVFIERSANIRIISARLATRQESNLYAQQFPNLNF